jgi:hypothetical protein
MPRPEKPAQFGSEGEVMRVDIPFAECQNKAVEIGLIPPLHPFQYILAAECVMCEKDYTNFRYIRTDYYNEVVEFYTL